MNAFEKKVFYLICSLKPKFNNKNLQYAHLILICLICSNFVHLGFIYIFILQKSRFNFLAIMIMHVQS